MLFVIGHAAEAEQYTASPKRRAPQRRN